HGIKPVAQRTIMLRHGLRFVPAALAAAAAAAAGGAWLLGCGSLFGPLSSLLLPTLVGLTQVALRRFGIALAYYAVGCWPIVGAVMGFWGVHLRGMAIAAWVGAAVLLALPWALPQRRGGLLAAMLLTALPPLGVIGWLSPMNAAGVLFPGMGGIGILLLCALVTAWPGAAVGHRPARHVVSLTLGMAAVANVLHTSLGAPEPPSGWVGVQTRIRPGHGNILKDIQNNQAVITEGLRQSAGARVVIFPEAILPDWYDGTRAQFAAVVPPGQIWILGVQTATHDAVVRVHHGVADPAPVARAAGLLLGGDWQPWNPYTLRPAWWQRTFDLEGQRVWAAICVEQVQPWTWLQAMWQRPTVILAQSNAWWAAPGNAAPAIQAASVRAWARLMGVPVVTAVNRHFCRSGQQCHRVRAF
ncbi:MAG: hypothetical protein ACP5GF_13250, partial [Thiomonas sp.]